MNNYYGHATIAIMYDLIKNDDTLLQFETVDIQTNRGKLSVKNKILNEDAVYIISPIPFYKPTNLNIVKISNALRTAQNEILLGFHSVVVQYIVPVQD
jgi:predicted PhzF superfamily epimerase YddE/YHI9